MKLPISAIMGSTRRVADAKRGRVMRRWHVIVQLCTGGIWREYPDMETMGTFRFRIDAERWANELRKRYPNPQRWNVSVLRRSVK